MDANQLQPWMQQVFEEIGIHCEVTPFPRLTGHQHDVLNTLPFRCFYIPRISERDYPSCFIPITWNQGLESIHCQHLPLVAGWRAIETVGQAPGRPVQYVNDMIARRVNLTHRFKFTARDVGHLCRGIAKNLRFPPQMVLLPSVEERNFLGNVMTWLSTQRGERLPDLGNMLANEWCRNSYASKGSQLTAGCGGLARIDRHLADKKARGTGFRTIIYLTST